MAPLQCQCQELDLQLFYQLQSLVRLYTRIEPECNV